MKKEIFVLPSMIIIMMIIVGIVLYINEPDDTELYTQPMDPIITLPTTVQKMTVTTEAQNYSIVLANPLYQIEGVPIEGLSIMNLYGVVDSFKNLQGTLEQENASDLAKYGLDSPIMSIDVACTEQSYTVDIGGVSELGYYANLRGENNVYTLNGLVINMLAYGPLGFAEMSLASVATDYYDVTNITFGGAVRETPLVIETQQASEMEALLGLASYKLTSPHNRLLAVDVVSEFAYSLVPLTADMAVAFATDDSILAQYGLAVPYSTADFTFVDQNGLVTSKSYKASAPVEDFAYLMVDELPVIYQISLEKLPWLTATYQDMMAIYQLLPYINDQSYVAVTTGDQRYQFDITVVDDDLTASYQGRTLDTELFRDFYEWIVGIPAESYTEERPDKDAEPLIYIEYRNRFTGIVDTVALYQKSDSEAFLSVNGETDALTQARYATIIEQNVRSLLSMQPIQPLI